MRDGRRQRNAPVSSSPSGNTSACRHETPTVRAVNACHSHPYYGSTPLAQTRPNSRPANLQDAYCHCSATPPFPAFSSQSMPPCHAARLTHLKLFSNQPVMGAERATRVGSSSHHPISRLIVAAPILWMWQFRSVTLGTTRRKTQASVIAHELTCSKQLHSASSRE